MLAMELQYNFNNYTLKQLCLVYFLKQFESLIYVFLLTKKSKPIEIKNVLFHKRYNNVR